MPTDDTVSQYNQIVVKLNEYHEKALWQEKLRLLQEALALCEEPGFPDAEARRREHLYDLGGIWRRLGQYDKAEDTLRDALRATGMTYPLQRATILGELGIVLRHSNRFAEAEEVLREQYDAARGAPPSLEADVVACRAIGNVAMCAYNRAQQTDPIDPGLLERAIEQLLERVRRAEDLQQRLQSEGPQSKALSLAKAWETIGLSRLSICYVAQGATEEAVRVASRSQQSQNNADPTMTGLSRFFYGNALWANGQRAEALAQWNAPKGVCSSPIALCKELSEEHSRYLKLMATAGVDFDSYDEQGYSALDYAVLSDSPDAKKMIPIITEAVRKRLAEGLVHDGLNANDIDRQLEEEITSRLHQAELRRQYRTVLQEHIRPLMRTKGPLSFASLRHAYSQFLYGDTRERRMFSPFRYVRYADFKAHGTLPKSSDALTKQSTADHTDADFNEDEFVVFISYRWLGCGSPDDADNSQWRRIINAIEGLIAVRPDLDAQRLGIWLDYACIDQVDMQEKMRGVNSLPLAVALCNAMISLVDDTYYERAWCSVEVMLISAVLQYGRHEWWEHRLDAPRTDLSTGTLEKQYSAQSFDLTELKLTKEREDRPKIDFLVRQSKLLGKDESVGGA